MKKLAITGLSIAIVIIGIFSYWIGAAEPYAQMIVAPSLISHPHMLIAFTLGFPSNIYGRFVRLQDANYIDAGVRFEQEKVWVYEELTWAGTSAHEDTLTGLVTLKGYKPKEDSVSVLFKLRDHAYVGDSEPPLQLATGPYTVQIEYKVLWFSRSRTFTLGEPYRYSPLP